MCDNALLHPPLGSGQNNLSVHCVKKGPLGLTSLKDDNSKLSSVASTSAVTYLRTHFLNQLCYNLPFTSLISKWRRVFSQVEMETPSRSISSVPPPKERASTSGHAQEVQNKTNEGRKGLLNAEWGVNDKVHTA